MTAEQIKTQLLAKTKYIRPANQTDKELLNDQDFFKKVYGEELVITHQYSENGIVKFEGKAPRWAVKMMQIVTHSDDLKWKELEDELTRT